MVLRYCYVIIIRYYLGFPYVATFVVFDVRLLRCSHTRHIFVTRLFCCTRLFFATPHTTHVDYPTVPVPLLLFPIVVPRVRDYNPVVPLVLPALVALPVDVGLRWRYSLPHTTYPCWIPAPPPVVDLVTLRRYLPHI